MRGRSLAFEVFAHVVLIVGVVIFIFPVYYTFIGSTHSLDAILDAPMPLLLGKEMVDNYKQALFKESIFIADAWQMMLNSFIVAIVITVGKIILSLLAAFAIVYFNFPFKSLLFALIFVTLMLPIEVRMLPTYEVISGLGMLNSYTGLTVPLLASATGTFLFRQFFLTVPRELVEAAKIDGASPMHFFFFILLPLSKTNIAALGVIMFVYGWNQYLWPLLITTDYEMATIVMGISQMVKVVDAVAPWHIIMATAILALLPPVLVITFMYRWFVKGLVDIEK